MRAIPLNQSTIEYRNYLTSSTLAFATVVAVNEDGLLVKADKADSTLLNVVGFVLTATAGGAMSTVPVKYKGIIQNPAWNFVAGKPVYLTSAGGVTQLISSFASTDWIVELGTAIGVNQLQIEIRRAVANSVATAGLYGVTGSAVQAALASKAGLSATAATAGKLAVFDTTTSLTSANTLTIPAKAGTIITDSSDVVGTDYN